MKYTKGPWGISKSGHPDFNLCIVAEDGGSVCHVTKWTEAEANTKLIAMAPEMHKALKTIVLCSNYEDAKNMYGHSPNHWTRTIESLLKELDNE
jgi:N-acetylglucosamine-6-phosphate deacetylase